MKKNSLLTLAFGLVILFGTVHFLANIFYFYWTLWWFDITMHFFGGLCLGLFAIWVLYSSGLFGIRAPSRQQAVWASIIAVLVIGAGWEIFEYVNGLTESTESYPLDVATDIVADTIGAAVAGIIGAKNRFHG